MYKNKSTFPNPFIKYTVVIILRQWFTKQRKVIIVHFPETNTWDKS
jgi:hypothetical protein